MWKKLARDNVQSLSEGTKVQYTHGGVSSETTVEHIDIDGNVFVNDLMPDNHYVLWDKGLYYKDFTTYNVHYWEEPVMKPETPPFPDFDFKLSCGDRPEVRQWLKDNGCVWNSGDDLERCMLSCSNLYVTSTFVTTNLIGNDLLKIQLKAFEKNELPEVTPTLSVTGFTCPEHEEKALHQQQQQRKIQKLEKTIQKAQEQINELKESEL